MRNLVVTDTYVYMYTTVYCKNVYMFYWYRPEVCPEIEYLSGINHFQPFSYLRNFPNIFLNIFLIPQQGTVALWSNASALDWKIEGLNLAANFFFQ